MLARRLAALLLLAACAPEPVTFPARPPLPGAAHWAFIIRATAAGAGAGATNCGAMTDRQTAARVYACAERHFVSRRPFYYLDFSHYFRPRSERRRLYTSTGSIGWFHPVRGWYSRGNGRVYLVTEKERTGRVRARLDYDERWKGPFRVGYLVQPPRWRKGEQAVERSPAGIRRRVTVEALISVDGTVERTKVINPVRPDLSTPVAEELVRRMRFHPATVFGRPVPVIWWVTVPVGDWR